MDQLTAILSSLEINHSIWYQFVIICLIFIMAKFVFIKKLQSVIETREEKTTKLESNAEAKFEEVQVLTESYNKKIKEAQFQAHETLSNGKEDLKRELDSIYRKEEKTQEELTLQERKKTDVEVQSYRDQVFKEKEALAQSLIDKVMQ